MVTYSRTQATVGRGDELEAIRAMVAALDDGPGALFLRGPTGIGKTQLWFDAVEWARAQGVCVLTTRPAGADARISFAGLRDLAGAVAEEVLPVLPEPQRRAFAVALLLEEPGTRAPDPGTVSASFLAALRLLARSRPLLVAIDDAQWLDASSREVLAFALRRLEDERVGLLATLRVSLDADSDDLLHALPQALTDRRDVGPLTVAALYELVRDRFGLSPARPMLLRLHELSGGNPFYALELARALSVSGQLSVPRGLSELLYERLLALSEPTREVLLATATLARPTRHTLEQVFGDVDQALAEAVAADIVEGDAEAIRFTHPLLASVHYESVTASTRRAVHGRLAGAALEPEERARHLALAAAEPSEDVARALDDAVLIAREHGALASAAELAELALAVTPLEAPALHLRTLTAADLSYACGDPVRAEQHLGDALERTVGGHERAEILYKQSQILFETDQTKAASILREALDCTGDDALLRVDVLVHLSATVRSLDWGAAVEYANEAVTLAEQAGNPRSLADALSVSGEMSFIETGDVPWETMQRAVALEKSAGLVSGGHWSATANYAQTLIEVWDLDLAREILEGLVAKARAEDDSGLTNPLANLAFVELLAGNLGLAAALAGEAADVAAQGARLHAEMYALFRLGWIEGLRGDVDLARQLCERSLRLAEQTSGFVRGARLSLGYLESSLEAYDIAWCYLDPADPKTGTMTPDRPVVHVPEAVEVLAALGRTGAARALLEPFEERAETLRRAWAITLAAHCRGLILAAEQDLGGAEKAAVEAVALAEKGRWPLPLGRALLALGTVQRQRRQKADARATLVRAVAEFEELGAAIWLARARRELRRIGGRSVPAGDALSETETQIAELVAAGKTNKEVAQALHLSRKTVEWNLSKIYRKLGVRSRTELAARTSE